MPDGPPPEPFNYEIAMNETIRVLEGRVQTQVIGGPAVELSSGDIASFRAGTSTRWTLRQVPFKELFVLS